MTKFWVEVDLVKDTDPSAFADKLQDFLFAVFDDESAWGEVDVLYGVDVAR